MSGPNRVSAKKRRRPRGFTFIELMLVLALIAIIFVASAPLVTASMRERQLRASADKIAEMVRDQRAEAQKNGRRRLIEVRSSGFYEKGEDGKQVAGLPGAALFRVRFPGKEWEKPENQIMEFSPIGMVTPLSVRLENGTAWIEVDFDMLTGRVAEERYAF